MLFQAILFDFDGVLANSEPLHFQSFAQVLKVMGHEFTSAAYLSRYIHGDDETVFRMLSADRDFGWSEQRVLELGAQKRAVFLDFLQDRDLLYPGVPDLVRSLRDQVPLAVVSMADRPLIERSLARAGIASCFELIVSASDVTRPKPDPQPYLQGLAGLNARRPPQPPIQPGACGVVEDSGGGVRSGKAAGMTVVGLTHNLPAASLREAGADHVFDGIGALRQWLS